MEKVIRINGIDVPVLDDELTGADIKEFGKIPEDRVVVRQEADRNVIVPDFTPVRLADGDTFTHHARHSKAGA